MVKKTGGQKKRGRPILRKSRDSYGAQVEPSGIFWVNPAPWILIRPPKKKSEILPRGGHLAGLRRREGQQPWPQSSALSGLWASSEDLGAVFRGKKRRSPWGFKGKPKAKPPFWAGE